MKCYKDKNIFNLFEYSDCVGCVSYQIDKRIKIGEVIVNIFYIQEGCKKMQFKNDYYHYLEVMISKKLKIFLKDSIISKLKNSNLIFLWLDDFDINNDFNMNILYDLLAFDEELYIIS